MQSITTVEQATAALDAVRAYQLYCQARVTCAMLTMHFVAHPRWPQIDERLRQRYERRWAKYQELLERAKQNDAS